eukprot:TRINITY_DN2229_c2_g1_i1.p1 TRINITY_DN2229_c2_g1~~TRINITY_DN2229_c2_g1_i1.p1  ORF type:complete len:426 (+),score=108.92 TRINITY_DN2229_c2_g1_i1:117-1394(+)
MARPWRRLGAPHWWCSLLGLAAAAAQNSTSTVTAGVNDTPAEALLCFSPRDAQCPLDNFERLGFCDFTRGSLPGLYDAFADELGLDVRTVIVERQVELEQGRCRAHPACSDAEYNHGCALEVRLVGAGDDPAARERLAECRDLPRLCYELENYGLRPHVDPTDPPSDEEDPLLPLWAWVLIVGVVLIILVWLTAWCCMRRQKRQRESAHFAMMQKVQQNYEQQIEDCGAEVELVPATPASPPAVEDPPAHPPAADAFVPVAVVPYRPGVPPGGGSLPPLPSQGSSSVTSGHSPLPSTRSQRGRGQRSEIVDIDEWATPTAPSAPPPRPVGRGRPHWGGGLLPYPQLAPTPRNDSLQSSPPSSPVVPYGAHAAYPQMSFGAAASSFGTPTHSYSPPAPGVRFQPANRGRGAAAMPPKSTPPPPRTL